MWLLSIPIGWMADWLIESNRMSPKNVRRIANSIGHLGSAAGLVGLAFTGCDQSLAIVWLCLSVGLNGAVYSGFQVIQYKIFLILQSDVTKHRMLIILQSDVTAH